MTAFPKIGYVGIGSSLPQKLLTNEDLSAMVDTSSDWIRRMTGVSERRVLGEGESLVDLASAAARAALDNAGISPEEVDDIRVGVTSWMQFPSLGARVQEVLGAERASASDVSAGCAGFVYAVEQAYDKILVEKLKYDRDTVSLVVGVDGLSRLIDWTDRNTCVLFGDGAGAVVLRQVDAGGILATHTHAKGRYGDLLYANPVTKTYLRMAGTEVYGIAIRTMVDDVRRVIEKYNRSAALPVEVSDVSFVYPHQANVRIIERVAELLELPRERVYSEGVARHGNTSNASIPLAYCDDAGRPRGGERALEIDVAFGAGFTSGALLREVVGPPLPRPGGPTVVDGL